MIKDYKMLKLSSLRALLIGALQEIKQISEGESRAQRDLRKMNEYLVLKYKKDLH